MGIMIDHIQITKLTLDSIVYPRQADGSWEGPWAVEGIVKNDEGYSICWRKGTDTYTQWTDYYFETWFDSSEDGWLEQEDERAAEKLDEAWRESEKARKDGHAEDLETAHSQSCDIEPRHGYKECPNNPQAWKITLLVTSSKPDWMDMDLPRFFGPLEVIAFAEAVEGSGEGFAEAMTLDEAEQLRL